MSHTSREQRGPRRGVFRVAVVDAAWVAIMLPAVLGAALLAWFMVTLFTPTAAKLGVGDEHELVLKAFCGQLYVLLVNGDVDFVLSYEQPGAPEPSVWSARWAAGQQARNYWFAGSLPMLSALLLLPGALWMTAQWLGSRRAARMRG